MRSELPTSTAATRSHSPPCDCRSDERSLVLLAADMAAVWGKVASAGGPDWRLYPDLNAVRVELGEGRRFSGVAELLGYLRAVLDADDVKALRAGWVPRGRAVHDELARLLHARPLLDMAPADSTPLMKILGGGRLETWLQPVVRAADYSVWGYECLMRGRTPEGELVPPGTMIEWSRQENLTFLLDRMCREAHLRNAARHVVGRDLFLLVNFLPTAIYDPAFCLATTLAAARAGGLEPGRIIFEVVETEQVKDVSHLRRILDHYRREGFGVALDDVGGGYAGLSMLGGLEPDLIKIDRHLIARAAESPMHRSICESLVRLGRQHGKLVLAEGIETAEERDLLGGMGADLFQGYLFGRPAPAG